MEERIKKLEEYCFNQNSQFQTDVKEAVLEVFEAGTPLGIGKRITKDYPAMLALSSPNKAFQVSQMNTTNRDALTNLSGAVTRGLIVFNTDTNKLNVYNGTTWEQITSI